MEVQLSFSNITSLLFQYHQWHQLFVLESTYYFIRKPSGMAHCKWYLVYPLVRVLFQTAVFVPRRHRWNKQRTRSRGLSDWADKNNISLAETSKALLRGQEHNTGQCSVTKHDHSTVFIHLYVYSTEGWNISDGSSQLDASINSKSQELCGQLFWYPPFPF